MSKLFKSMRIYFIISDTFRRIIFQRTQRKLSRLEFYLTKLYFIFVGVCYLFYFKSNKLPSFEENGKAHPITLFAGYIYSKLHILLGVSQD